MSFSRVPNQVDFTTFLYSVAGIDPICLPSTSSDITDALAVALAVVSPDLANLAGNLYVLAVYNLGTDNLINYAMDQLGQTYFQSLRTSYGINLFVPGVTASSSDSGTAQSRNNPEFMKTMTFGDLQNLKTPFGRAYLNIAQQRGTLWGIS